MPGTVLKALSARYLMLSISSITVPDKEMGHSATHGQSREFKLRSLLSWRPLVLIPVLSCLLEPTEGHFALLDDFQLGPLLLLAFRRVSLHSSQ